MSKKETNPKESVGIKKIPFSTLSGPVLAHMAVAMMEGARKYGRHNYRITGIKHSVYYDAALRHLTDFWEGMDTDPDSGLSHLIKAMTSLMVWADAIIQGTDIDDRPPSSPADWQKQLQPIIDAMFLKHPKSVPAFVITDKSKVKKNDKR